MMTLADRLDLQADTWTDPADLYAEEREQDDDPWAEQEPPPAPQLVSDDPTPAELGLAWGLDDSREPQPEEFFPGLHGKRYD